MSRSGHKHILDQFWTGVKVYQRFNYKKLIMDLLCMYGIAVAIICFLAFMAKHGFLPSSFLSKIRNQHLMESTKGLFQILFGGRYTIEMLVFIFRHKSKYIIFHEGMDVKIYLVTMGSVSVSNLILIWIDQIIQA